MGGVVHQRAVTCRHCPTNTHGLKNWFNIFGVLSPDGLPESIFAMKMNGRNSSHFQVAAGSIVSNYIPGVYIANVCLEHKWHKSLPYN
jgi:hypothetical protein